MKETNAFRYFIYWYSAIGLVGGIVLLDIPSILIMLMILYLVLNKKLWDECMDLKLGG